MRRTTSEVTVLFTLLAAAFAAGSAAARARAAVAPVAFAWRPAAGIDRETLTALTCPSNQLCVAVDAHGGILSSTTPRSPRSWRRAAVDGAERLNSVACPSTTLCVAVDAAGNVARSSDPAGPASAWTVAAEDPSGGLTGVSCPSLRLCVAVDAGGNAAVSTAPASAAPWTVFHVDNGQNYECLHYGDTDCTGSASPLAVSCGSVSLCAESDDSGGLYWSDDPAGGSATWAGRSGGVPVDSGFDGISCPSQAFCAWVDRDGGDVWTGRLSGRSPQTMTETSAHFGGDIGAALAGVTCPTTTLCLAYGASGNGNVFVSGTPTRRASWRGERAGRGQYLNAVSCRPAWCIALDPTRLMVGDRLPPPRVLRAELRRRLRGATRHAAHLGRAITLSAPGAGRLTLTLRAGRLTLARGVVTARGPGQVRLKLSLTARGRQVLRQAAPGAARATLHYVAAGSGAGAIASSRATISGA